MIKGKLSQELNEFEFEIQTLIGNYHDRSGYLYYFELLHEIFSKSSKFLLSESQKFKEELENETTDDIPGLILSSQYAYNPLVEKLYSSYFITVNSEFEMMLNEARNIVEKYYDISNFPKKANSSFRDFKVEENNLQFFKNTLLEHDILVIYNYIRNGMTHSKNDITCKLYLELKKHIESGKINFLEIINNDNGFGFLITEIDFIRNYIKEIISFFQDLINNSTKHRNQLL